MGKKFFTEDSLKTLINTIKSLLDGKASSSHNHSISNITNLQSSLDGKQNNITGAATTIASSDLTANRALVSNSSGKVAVSAVTSTELGYLDGVTSAVQTQLDGKAASSHTHSISNVTNLQTTLDNKAAQADLNSHTSDTTVHITNAERANWNAAESNSIAAANSYTDDKIANLLENSTEAIDSIFELRDAMEENADAISALETIAAGHADKIHTHKVEDITDITVDATEINYLDGVTSNVQTQLDGKSNSGHTHDDKMDKNNPTGTGSFSLNRKAYSDIGNYSFAEGYNTISSGEASHAEGTQTIASGYDSHAEGFTTEASGVASHSEGYKTIASGVASHAEGGRYILSPNGDLEDSTTRTISATSYPIIGDTDITISSTTAQGAQSHAEGTQTFAFGYSSHAEGYQTNALGKYSHAEGYGTTASGDYSHAKGIRTSALDTASHAEGYEAIASGHSSHAEGGVTEASGSYSHAEGFVSISSGIASHAEGGRVNEAGSGVLSDRSISATTYPVIGDNTIIISSSTAQGIQSHAEGAQTFAFGYGSHAEGYQTNALGKHSHAEGDRTVASGDYSHAEGGFHGGPGSGSVASGNYSHAEGCATKASGGKSHAEGSGTTASGESSHAEGSNTEASNLCSHAEGYLTKASGLSSHTEGWATAASGKYSHAEGWNTIASSEYQHVQGKYNIEDTTNTYAHIVGNGSSSARSNAHTLDWNGNAWFAGNVTVGANNVRLATTNDLSSYLPLAGGTITGSLNAKFSNIDASLPKNGVTSAQYPTTFSILDKSNRILTRNEAIINTDGSIAAYWYVRNYNTSGKQVAQKGIKISMNKSGAVSYSVDEGSKFLSAIGGAASGHTHDDRYYTESEVNTLINNKIKFHTWEKEITVPGTGAYTFTMGGVYNPGSGYTFLGYLNKDGGYTDQWLISYGTYGSNVVAMVYSKYGASLTKDISCTGVWIKN